MARTAARGFSLIGLLITMACILVLSVILMTALNKAVTGEGSVLKNTVRSTQDQFQLYSLIQSMIVGANDFRGDYLIPSRLALDEDIAHDTTAALFSAMIMQKYTTPEQVVSPNEYSPEVWVDEDYDYLLYDPAGGVFWDPSFSADLKRESNVSYAHMPLFGDRLKRYWQSRYNPNFPVIGNRGPKDGMDDPYSYTYGANGQWAGHVAFGDGHVEFLETWTPGNVYFERDGQRYADNIFAMEDGPDGRDAILAFTLQMTRQGPVLQYD